MFKKTQTALIRAREIDRDLGRKAEKASRWIWRWRENWLLAVVGSLATADFLSTYTILKLSGKTNVYESGVIANWALEGGGWGFLFLIDFSAAAALSLLACIFRYLYSKKGYVGYGRAAFVFILMPYILFATFAVINNLVMLIL
jgi:hypothetical protein